MNYARESLDLPPLALAAAALAIFTLGYIGSGPTFGGIFVTAAAIVRELAVHRSGNEVSR